MRLAQSYFKIYFLSTIRNIPALFFTLIFPPFILLISAGMWGTARADRLSAFIVFLNYSVQTVSLMLLGMGVSQEKNSAWSKYLRTLPVRPSTMVMGRILHTLFLCFLNLSILSLISVFVLSIPMHFHEWIYFCFIALLGGIPMSLIGMTIGYAASPESSRSIFTLLNLLLLFGSIKMPTEGFFAFFSSFVPTYQWRMLSTKIISPHISLTTPVICLVSYSLLFLFLFQKIYLKSQKQ